MVCRGCRWKIPCYVVDDTVKGVAPGGATACHNLSQGRAKKTILQDSTLFDVMHTPQFCTHSLARAIA